VTLSGNIDFAAANVTGTQIGSNGNTISTTTGTSSTSVINIDAIEDLGGNLKAKAHYGLDPRTLSNDSLSNTGAQAAGTSGAYANTTTGLARDEVFVGLAGNYGEIKLGAPNSIGLNVFQAASPLGTGVGSGYAPNAGTQTNSIVNTRYNRSARFDSATYAGFTASALYAPGDDLAQVDTQAAGQIPNARRTTEIGLKYANGPLNVALVNIKQDSMVNKTGYYSGSLASAAQPVATSATVIGANYAFNTGTTVYVGYNTGDRLAAKSSSAGDAVQSKGKRFAVKQTLGQIDLIAQRSTQKTTGASADAKGTVTGLRADYNFSKTAAVYAGYEAWKTNLAAAAGTAGATAGTTGDRTIVSIGLRKSF